MKYLFLFFLLFSLHLSSDFHQKSARVPASLNANGGLDTDSASSSTSDQKARKKPLTLAERLKIKNQNAQIAAAQKQQEEMQMKVTAIQNENAQLAANLEMLKLYSEPQASLGSVDNTEMMKQFEALNEQNKNYAFDDTSLGLGEVPSELGDYYSNTLPNAKRISDTRNQAAEYSPYVQMDSLRQDNRMMSL